MGHASTSGAQQQGKASEDLLSGPERARSTPYNTVPEEHLYYSLGLIRKGVGIFPERTPAETQLSRDPAQDELKSA